MYFKQILAPEPADTPSSLAQGDVQIKGCKFFSNKSMSLKHLTSFCHSQGTFSCEKQKKDHKMVIKLDFFFSFKLT